MTKISLSFKATGLLFHISREGAVGGAKGLSEASEDGVKSIYSGLTELRANGLITLIKGKTDKQQYWSRVEITDKGKAYLKSYGRVPKRRTEPCAKTADSISLNSNLAHYPNSIEAYSVNQGAEQSSAHEKEEPFIGVDVPLNANFIDPDDLEAEIAKDQKRKAEERKEAKQKKSADRQKIRASRPIEKWTPADLVNYYAEQIKQIWRVADVQTTERPAFIRALKLFRDDYGTNGQIEKEMLDRYLAKRKSENKELPNAHMLFMGFIGYAPSMIDEVVRSQQPEDLGYVDAAKVKRRAQLGMDNVQA